MTTGTLPREIPSDPAEQERLMPQWVKEEWLRLMIRLDPDDIAYTLDDCSPRLIAYWATALTIWQWCPEPVEPDLQMAREVLAGRYPDLAHRYLSGELDCAMHIKDCLAMAKRVREAKQ